MVVIVLSAAPVGLRGALTRWLAEISPGVFVGNISGRVRDQVWELVRENIGMGRATLVHSARNEQRYAVETIGHEREVIDMEGFLAMRIPSDSGEVRGSVRSDRPPTEGWSIAGRRRKFGSATRRALKEK